MLLTDLSGPDKLWIRNMSMVVMEDTLSSNRVMTAPMRVRMLCLCLGTNDAQLVC